MIKNLMIKWIIAKTDKPISFFADVLFNGIIGANDFCKFVVGGQKTKKN